MAEGPKPPRVKLEDILDRVQKERGWSETEAREAELWYLRFLALSHQRGNRPTFGISEKSDYLWHAHILLTRRYRADCQRIFGAYLDHTPTPGGRPRVSSTRLTAARRLYIKTFGAAPADLTDACYTP